MDKQLAADRIRTRFEKRLANFLGCETADLPRMKLGALVHMLFLFLGDTEEMGGFSTSMGGVLKILGNDAVWEEPKPEAVEMPKVVVN